MTVGSNAALGAGYTCTLKARDHFMHRFETITGHFTGERPLELRRQIFVFKLIPTIVDGRDQLGVLLRAQDDSSSAVTLAEPDQKSLYMNFSQGDSFAVATCVAD